MRVDLSMMRKRSWNLVDTLTVNLEGDANADGR